MQIVQNRRVRVLRKGSVRPWKKLVTKKGAPLIRASTFMVYN
jgi:hypothetical protein